MDVTMDETMDKTMDQPNSQLQALLDKEGIRETLIRYAVSIDSDNLELFDQVFLADAVVDYSAAGGVYGNYQELRDWLRKALSKFNSWQHLLSNIVIQLDGDTATTITGCYNPLAGVDEQGNNYVIHVGCQYNDQLKRTEQGWRIAKRDLLVVWQDD